MAAKFNSIQLLRAIAALMVVVFHSKSAIFPSEHREQLLWWPGWSDHGALGVSLFFVISGFIIASVISSPKFAIGDYFWRRFWRIYPLYWLVMCVALFMFAWRNWYSADIEALGASGMIKSFLILPLQPFPFWNPGWSLEHELIFYIIAAVVAPLLGLRALAALMVALAVIGMRYSVGWDYHLFSDAQLYFGAGIVAYLMRDRRWFEALPAALLLLGYAYAFYYGWMPHIPYQIASFAFAFGASALIVALLDFERLGWRVPRPAIAIGDASYSLYLWHWLVLPFASWGRDDWGGHPEFWRWVIVAVSILAALASYRWIEKPLIAFSHRKRRAPEAVPAE